MMSTKSRPNFAGAWEGCEWEELLGIVLTKSFQFSEWRLDMLCMVEDENTGGERDLVTSVN